MAAFTVSTATPNRKQEGTALTYAWDLDGDGQYDDATGRTTSRSYARAGTVTVRLRVTDARSGTATAQRTITVANRG